jgi:enoyl-CoA hydratase/carnithine racemase
VAFKNVIYARDRAIATITINRPEQRNALSSDTVEELREAFRQARDDSDTRAIVLTGAGTVFCAGADLKEFRAEATESHQHFERGHMVDLFAEMTQLGKPTIARINGHAMGGGFGLAVACDLGIAADDAQFGMPEVNVGLFPMIIMAIVSRNLPRKAGMELMLTGKRINAQEAERIGAINRSVPREQLDVEVGRLATELAKKSPVGLRLGLEAFYRAQDMSFSAALAYLQDQLVILSATDDLREGVTAFLEKREPRFTGR